jgi:hypothetical protein
MRIHLIAHLMMSLLICSGALTTPSLASPEHRLRVRRPPKPDGAKLASKKLDKVHAAGRDAFDHLYVTEMPKVGGVGTCALTSGRLAKELVEKHGIAAEDLRWVHVEKPERSPFDEQRIDEGWLFPNKRAIRPEILAVKSAPNWRRHEALITKDGRVFDLQVNAELWGKDLRTWATSLFGTSKHPDAFRLVVGAVEPLLKTLPGWEEGSAFMPPWRRVAKKGFELGGGGVTSMKEVLDTSKPLELESDMPDPPMHP